MEFQFILFFFLLLISLSIPTRAETHEYFIKCGSSSNTTVDDGRSFTGDGTTGVKLLGKHRSLVKDAGNQSELYRTAVIFNSPGRCQFTISENGTYFLRLHFYAFSSSPAIMAAQFSVSASGHLLFSDFSGKASLNSLVIKEFLLTVLKGEFNMAVDHFLVILCLNVLNRLTTLIFKLETDMKILTEKASMALSKYKMHAVVANELSSRKEEVTVVSRDENIRIQRDKNKVGSDVESPLIELIVARHSTYIEGGDAK